jgi:phage terminase small subunit
LVAVAKRTGDKPLPTALKKLRGTVRLDRLNPNEPEPRTLKKVPTAPSWLPEEAKEVWRDLAGILVDLRVLTVADLTMLTVLCVLQGQFIEATKAGEVFGVARTGKLQSLLGEFGLSPASRSRVKAEPTGDNKDLEAEYFENRN